MFNKLINNILPPPINKAHSLAAACFAQYGLWVLLMNSLLILFKVYYRLFEKPVFYPCLSRIAIEKSIFWLGKNKFDRSVPPCI
jgi:hypothetical protein